MLDLHFHSRLSDWCLTAEQIIELAQPGDTLTCTDHDIVNDGFVSLAKNQGIQTCESVEISCYDPETPDRIQLHVTYYANKIDQVLRDALATMRKHKIERIRLTLEKLYANGFLLDIPAFYEQYKKDWFNLENLNNSHIAEHILRLQENRTHIESLTGESITERSDFINACLKYGGKHAWIGTSDIDLRDKCNLDITYLIRHAKEESAITSLAHPNFSLKKPDRYKELAGKYLAMWLSAIEMNTAATPEWIELIEKTREQYDHLLTFGSDCHFENWKDDGKHSTLGEMNPFLEADFIKKETEKVFAWFGA